MLRRQRMRRLLMIAALAAVCVLAALWRGPALRLERIGEPSPAPSPAGFDRTVVTREVLLPSETWYAIQTGVFSTQEAALARADAYADRGAPGTVVQDGGKWRVFIASYGQEEDAAEVRRRLGDVQQVETYLYAWTCPELRLRLSGMAGQLDAAEAGLTLMSGAGERLRDLSTLLDAGQVTVEEAQQALSEMNGQIVLWQETARERFGSRSPDLVQRLLQMAQGWKDRYSALRAASSATALSAELKTQGMALYQESAALRKALNGE